MTPRYERRDRPQIEEHQKIRFTMSGDALLSVGGRLLVWILSTLGAAEAMNKAGTVSPIVVYLIHIILFFWTMQPIWKEVRTIKYYDEKRH